MHRSRDDLPSRLPDGGAGGLIPVLEGHANRALASPASYVNAVTPSEVTKIKTTRVVFSKEEPTIESDNRMGFRIEEPTMFPAKAVDCIAMHFSRSLGVEVILEQRDHLFRGRRWNLSFLATDGNMEKILRRGAVDPFRPSQPAAATEPAKEEGPGRKGWPSALRPDLGLVALLVAFWSACEFTDLFYVDRRLYLGTLGFLAVAIAVPYFR
jgi:hypothetical protein